MQPLLSSSRHWAVKMMTIRPSPAGAWARMAALIAVMVLLTGAIQLYAQGRTATTSLVLQVRPEELLQVQNGNVVLKIRLARGTTARLWAAESCTVSSPESQVINASGTYTIALNTLISTSSNPASGTMQVCLASSDGGLSDSVPVEILATGNNASAHGATPVMSPPGAAANVPPGWTVTTQAGTTT